MILRTFKEPGVGFYLSEVHRLRAECLLRLDPANFNEALVEFETAIATAKQQEARTFWLRAAIGLASAWAARGSPAKATAQLQEAVSAFSGDDEPAELAIAQEILASANGLSE
jgi:ATP/maltotriose-dependent transcriptional regulator MalT